MLRIKKLNKYPIEVQWEVENPEELEYDEYIDPRPCFYWKEKRYFLDKQLRLHNNNFIEHLLPGFVHGTICLGFDSFSFVEIIHGMDDCVNIYELEEIDDEN